MRTFNLIFLLTLFIGCSENQSINLYDEIEFGAPYSIIETSILPIINSDTLKSKVSYSGCNDGHEFELKNRLVNSTAEIWLFKQTEGQLCEAYFEEEKTYHLSESILSAKNIILITPNEDRITLK